MYTKTQDTITGEHPSTFCELGDTPECFVSYVFTLTETTNEGVERERVAAGRANADLVCIACT